MNRRQGNNSYADIPPPIGDQTYTQYLQRHHSVPENLSGAASSALSSSQPQTIPSRHLTNRHTSNRSISTIPNDDILEIGQDFSIPTYDETISRDQELVNAARMSVSSSVQSNSASSIPIQDSSNLRVDQSNTSSNQDLSDNANERRQNKNLLKILGLNFLNAKQHMALAVCRDCVLILPLYHAFNCFRLAYYLDRNKIVRTGSDINASIIEQLISPGSSEHFIAGIWCIVAAYLSFAVLDGLVVRWIVTYQTSAAILRVLSMSLLIITIEQATLAIFSPGGAYSLHTWIFISCILTGAYIIQNFVTSNLDLKNGNRARSVDYYNITVYAVVPVGLASFVSMIGLLRSLLILRLDIENRELGTDKMTTWIF